MLARAYATTKPEDKEFKIIPKATLVISPALRLESMRFWEDVWVSRDGPMMTDYRSPSWNAIVFLMDQVVILTISRSEITCPNHLLGRLMSHSAGN